MLNLNEEYTYYKEKDFINYCLGVFRYEEDHETFEDMEVFFSDATGMLKFAIDYEDVVARKKLAKSIFKRVKESDDAYRMFRCDFDFNMLDGEEERFEEDWKEIRAMFDAYCREYNVSGFIFTHFSQKNKETIDMLLTRHIHIIYTEPFNAPDFFEFVQKHMK